MLDPDAEMELQPFLQIGGGIPKHQASGEGTHELKAQRANDPFLPCEIKPGNDRAYHFASPAGKIGRQLCSR